MRWVLLWVFEYGGNSCGSGGCGCRLIRFVEGRVGVGSMYFVVWFGFRGYSGIVRVGVFWKVGLIGFMDLCGCWVGGWFE